MSPISSISNSIQNVTNQINSIQQQLTTGLAQLDAGKQGQATRLSMKVNLLNSMSSNAGDIGKAISVGITGLASISTIMQQMQALAMQANTNGTTLADQTSLNASFQALAGQITSIANQSSYGSKNLVANSNKTATTATFTVPVGISSTNGTNTFTVSYGCDASTFTKAFQALSLVGAGANNLVANANTALSTVNDAIGLIGIAQSTLSASQTGLNAALGVTSGLISNYQSSLDSIQKVDATALQSQLQELNNQQSIDYYLITQLNQQSAAKLVVFR